MERVCRPIWNAAISRQAANEINQQRYLKYFVKEKGRACSRLSFARDKSVAERS